MLKADKWWNDKGAPVFAQAYFLIGADVAAWPLSRTLLCLGAFMIAFVGVAGFGHVVNDLFDIEADRAVNKRNLLARATKGRIVFLLAGTLALSWLPWLVLPANRWNLLLVALQLALLLAYASPPLRLKERALPGVLADGLYAYTIPLLITWATFRPAGASDVAPWALLTILIGWSLCGGLRGILMHQVLDADTDVAAGVRTFVTRYGVERSMLIVKRVVMPVELGALLAAAPWLFGSPVLFVAVAAAFVWQRVHQIGGWGNGWPTYRAEPRRWVQTYGFLFLGELSTRWLPLVILASLVARSPRFAVLAVAHLLLFRTAIGDVVGPRARRLFRRMAISGESSRA